MHNKRSIDSVIDRLSQLVQFISHPGEKGRLAEFVISEWLKIVLPQKYSIGSGFVAAVRDGKNLELSSQQDIIIYDNHHCTPILATAVGGIFPIEFVYATIEVKTTLEKGVRTKSKNKNIPTGLYKTFRSIKHIRCLAENKSYLRLIEGKRHATFEIVPSKLPPRSYIMAFDTKIVDLRKAVTSIMANDDMCNTYYHGIVIIGKNHNKFAWYPTDKFDENHKNCVIEVSESNGWEKFSDKLLLSLRVWMLTYF